MRPPGLAPTWATETDFDHSVDPDVPLIDDGTPTRNPTSATRKAYGYPPDMAPSATEYNSEFGRATDFIRYLDGIDARSYGNPRVMGAGGYAPGQAASEASAVRDPVAWNPVLKLYHVVAGVGNLMGIYAPDAHKSDPGSVVPTVTVQGSVVCTKLGWCVANIGSSYHLYGRSAASTWSAAVLDANATTYRLTLDDTEAGGDPVMVWGCGENTSTVKAGVWCVTNAGAAWTVTHQNLPSPLAWSGGFKVFFAAGPTRKVFAVLDNANAVHMWDAPVAAGVAHTWTARGTGTFGAMAELFYSATDGLFVALVGRDCYVSANGIAWIHQGALPTPWVWGEAARAIGGVWLAQGITGPSGSVNALAVSQDQGLTWDLIPYPNAAPPSETAFTGIAGISASDVDGTPVWDLDGNPNTPAAHQRAVTNLAFGIDLALPKGATVVKIEAGIKGSSGHGALPVTKPVLRLDSLAYDGTTVALVSVTDGSASVPAYEAAHTISSGDINVVVGDERLAVQVLGESGTHGQVGLLFYGVRATYYPPGANLLGGPGAIVMGQNEALFVNGLRGVFGLRTR